MKKDTQIMLSLILITILGLGSSIIWAINLNSEPFVPLNPPCPSIQMYQTYGPNCSAEVRERIISINKSLKGR